MTTYKFGDILLVPFPFTDQTLKKKRPAVVIISSPYNQQKPDLIIMPITSQIKLPLTLGELQIIDFLSAGLIKPSVIKPIISTIEKSLVIRKLGQLKNIDCQNFKNIIPVIIEN
ncbi:type II toxin-antitoxin system PemK/MazF family toxin [Crocosphaera sp. UHCC 0190]|uniref:type II toxin-antitoxin system PemK/MazF family toxin n=1 Tax=Crocosphaera sp. UHCC 0190 TaxID=3110246 RepID=UPI002B1ED9E8|nr:type II toxin-antitoxin system PemK/MazF family toxin [Crocosphaera sp. UHCC 0190]MEA5508479.1 type II toxin-antitoxin system PemK/MazF family toxin [Crocosphaera sp. UHCC 0190]